MGLFKVYWNYRAVRRNQFDQWFGYKNGCSQFKRNPSVYLSGLLWVAFLTLASFLFYQLYYGPSSQYQITGRHILETTSSSSSNISLIYVFDGTKCTLENSSTSHSAVSWESCDYEVATNNPGAWITLYVLLTIVIFIAIAIICDDFFVPSLEAISEKLSLSEDVAGATFMAAGSSAPELFSSIAAVTFNSDVGIGTIVGSAVFNLLVIIALTVAFSKTILHLDWRPLTRDSVFYLFSIGWFIFAVWDTLIHVYDAVIMLVIYAVYIIYMRFNHVMMDRCDGCGNNCSCTFFAQVKPESENPENAVQMSNSRPSTGQSKDSSKKGDFIKDEIVTNGTSIGQQNRKRSSNPSMDDKHRGSQIFHHDRRNSILNAIAYNEEKRMSIVPHGHLVVNENITEVNDEEDGDEEELKDEPYSMPTIECCCKCCPPIRGAPPSKEDLEKDVSEAETPAKECSIKFIFGLKWIIFVLAFPFLILFSYTIPDCSKAKNKKYFMVSFLTSVLWIMALSFGMVTVVSRAGCLMGVDSFVMSLVVLAAGTSIPDLLSSIIVARDGYGDMAISNAIGSNVFDINLGLGLPFLVRILINKGNPISLFSQKERAAWCTNTMEVMPHPKFGFIMIAILLICYFIFIMVKFRLSRSIGISFFFIYILFLVYAFIQEFICTKNRNYVC